jgi:hypothetical protein
VSWKTFLISSPGNDDRVCFGCWWSSGYQLRKVTRKWQSRENWTNHLDLMMLLSFISTLDDGPWWTEVILGIGLKTSSRWRWPNLNGTPTPVAAFHRLTTLLHTTRVFCVTGSWETWEWLSHNCRSLNMQMTVESQEDLDISHLATHLHDDPT